MSKILSIDDMLEAANQCKLPTYDLHVQALESAANYLAEQLAEHLGIKQVGTANWEGKDFAGLCACFRPKALGQVCPKVIDDGDPGGDWEYVQIEQSETETNSGS